MKEYEYPIYIVESLLDDFQDDDIDMSDSVEIDGYIDDAFYLDNRKKQEEDIYNALRINMALPRNRTINCKKLNYMLYVALRDSGVFRDKPIVHDFFARSGGSPLPESGVVNTDSEMAIGTSVYFKAFRQIEFRNIHRLIEALMFTLTEFLEPDDMVLQSVEYTDWDYKTFIKIPSNCFIKENDLADIYATGVLRIPFDKDHSYGFLWDFRDRKYVDSSNEYVEDRYSILKNRFSFANRFFRNGPREFRKFGLDMVPVSQCFELKKDGGAYVTVSMSLSDGVSEISYMEMMNAVYRSFLPYVKGKMSHYRNMYLLIKMDFFDRITDLPKEHLYTIEHPSNGFSDMTVVIKKFHIRYDCDDDLIDAVFLGPDGKLFKDEFHELDISEDHIKMFKKIAPKTQEKIQKMME